VTDPIPVPIPAPATLVVTGHPGAPIAAGVSVGSSAAGVSVGSSAATADSQGRRARTALLAAPAWQVWGALLIVYVVWGSTYLGVRIVVETMPPLFALGMRFGLAAVIMGAILVVRKGPRVLLISRPQLRGALLIGALLLGIGNGGVMLGERDVPSGLAALMIGVIPLVVLIIRRLMGEAIDRNQVAGVTVGMIGLVILVAPLGLDGSVAPLGILLLLGSTIGWAYGSVLSRVVQLPPDPFVSTFYQFLAGCLFGFVASGLTGEIAGADPSTWSMQSLVALAYLVTFGSLIAFSAFTWLLQHAPVTRITTYAYVNPVVAVALGWFVLGEAITPPMIVGATMILASVALIIRLQRPPKPVPEPA
jgi:drug/metabolite transporter (DMT)-like permease